LYPGIDNGDFEESVIRRSFELPVVVLFDGALARPLWIFEAVLAEEVAARRGRVDLVKVDVERAPWLAERFRVKMVPAVRAFRHGQEVGSLLAARPRAELERFLDSLLGPGEAERLTEELRAEREWPDVVAALDERDYERALGLLLRRAERGDSVTRERVRRLMLSLFSELGSEHPLTTRYRRRLARVLY
jgi:thioredoxin-like negative regulator of GroEL